MNDLINMILTDTVIKSVVVSSFFLGATIGSISMNNWWLEKTKEKEKKKKGGDENEVV